MPDFRSAARYVLKFFLYLLVMFVGSFVGLYFEFVMVSFVGYRTMFSTYPLFGALFGLVLFHEFDVPSKVCRYLGLDQGSVDVSG